MKALLLQDYGKTGRLSFENIPRPGIRDDEVLVKVYAVGLNPIDNMIPKGTFKPILRFTLPAVIGSDLAGVVENIGKNVTRFRPGDAVFASVFDMDRGALSEYVAVPESAAALKPMSLSFTQAASLPMVALTSWQAFEHAKLKPGQKVFIPAGSGGIGTFAIQLAKYLGASVTTTTSAANTGLVTSLGADHVIDYRRQNVEQAPADCDLVLGTVRGDSLEKSLEILKPHGEIVSLIGPPDLAFARKRGMNIVMKAVFWLLSRKIISRAADRQVNYSFFFVRPDGSQLTKIATLIDAGKLKPVIDRTFPFDDSLSALAYLADGHAKGKVVVQIVES
ncbi:Zinc-type alcohol dehydrogenase-like protein SA1988 [Serratia quinivorans]|nr:Zinc-type alcohol dehydrogenase-like protein SA1988 [Serratia quinivorans]